MTVVTESSAATGTRRRSAATIIAASLLAAACAGGGGGDHGVMVYTLGNDTIAVEQFSWVGNRVDGMVVQRDPTTRLRRYSLTLHPDGSPDRLEYSLRRPDSTAIPGQMVTGSWVFSHDSVVVNRTWASLALGTPESRIQQQQGDSTSTVVVDTHGKWAFPFAVSDWYGLYEPMVAWLRASGSDTLSEAALPVMNDGVIPLDMALADSTNIRVWWFFAGGPILLNLNENGYILSGDARPTTVKELASRTDLLDVDSLIAAYDARDREGKALGVISPRDTVTGTFGKAHLWVDYGRPYKRGRQIVGGLVPFDQVWRTGANAATQFRTDVDLDINGVTIPAGMYTLWTIPTKEGGTLVVNKETGQWGTQYDGTRDLVRIPITRETVDTSVDQFTITLEPGSQDGVMAFLWDTARFVIPVKPR